MLRVTSILGEEEEQRFKGRMIEHLPVSSADAGKRRLRAHTDAGTDVAVNLPRGDAYLRHGAVLADDGTRIVVVERTAEEAMVVRFAEGLDRSQLAAEAVALGHAFGNQHVPLEIVDCEVRARLTTSREVALETVRALGLRGVEVSFEAVRLGCDKPLPRGTRALALRA